MTRKRCRWPLQEAAYDAMALTDWLEPNPRSPDRADSAAWIAEVLDEPHTREVLDSLLEAVRTTPTTLTDKGSHGPTLDLTAKRTPTCSRGRR